MVHKILFFLFIFLSFSALSQIDRSKYDIIFNYRDISIVKKEGKKGCLNSYGEEIIPLEYEEISIYDEPYDAIIAKTFHQKYEMFDMTGKQLLPPIYDYIKVFHYEKKY